MKVTNEMVERACSTYWPHHWTGYFTEPRRSEIRKAMRAALEAALSAGGAPAPESGVDEAALQAALDYTSSVMADIDTAEMREAIRIYLGAAASPAPQSHLSVPTTGPWQWFAGSDEEWCTVGPEDSRDAIIQAAINDLLGETDDDGSWKLAFHIVEARQDPLRLADWIECDRLIERAEDNVADSDRTGSEYDDGPWFKCTPEQEKDLEERMKRACDEWQAAHGLVFSCSTFSHTRNQEHVVVDHPQNAEGSDNG